MDLEYIESLYAKYRLGVICETHEQRVQVIEYFLSCGIEHGASGYSKRVLDIDGTREERQWPNIFIRCTNQYEIGGTRAKDGVSFSDFLLDVGTMNIPDLEEFV